MATFEEPSRRVLCLHGAGSRGSIFQEELRPLFSAIIGRGMLLDFNCIDGAFECVGEPRLVAAAHPGGGKYYSFLNATKAARLYDEKDLYPSPPDTARGAYVKLPEALAAFRAMRLPDGDGAAYEGVVGFGEGADLAAMLLADAERRRTPPLFRWAVLMCGGDHGWAAALKARGELFREPLAETPTLCTFGRRADARETRAFQTLVGGGALEIASHEGGRAPFPADRAAATAHATKIAGFVGRIMAPARYADVARLTTPLLPLPPPEAAAGAGDDEAEDAPPPRRPGTAEGGTQT